jgi:hypothetical protein
MCPVDDRGARAEEYRNIAERIRELARRSRFREIKEELYDWAFRYDQIADFFKSAKIKPVAKRCRRRRPHNSQNRMNA